MSEKLYDLEPLNMLSDGNEKFRRTLIELFNETTPPILEDIRNSYAAKDWIGLYAHLHKIKPTIDSMGIRTVKPLINEMMKQAKSERDSETLSHKVTSFCATVEETIEQLKTNEL